MHTAEGLQLHSLYGIHVEACAANRVVDAEATLLVGAEYEAAAELVVDIAERKVDIAFWKFQFQVEVRHTPSLEFRFEAGKRVFSEFKSCTGIKVLTV